MAVSIDWDLSNGQDVNAATDVNGSATPIPCAGAVTAGGWQIDDGNLLPFLAQPPLPDFKFTLDPTAAPLSNGGWFLISVYIWDDYAELTIDSRVIHTPEPPPPPDPTRNPSYAKST